MRLQSSDGSLQLRISTFSFQREMRREPEKDLRKETASSIREYVSKTSAHTRAIVEERVDLLSALLSLSRELSTVLIVALRPANEVKRAALLSILILRHDLITF